MDPVSANSASEVHSLLVNAFDRDPMITTLFSGKGRKKQMDNFFRFLVKKSQLLNEQMFGERVGKKWAVVADLEFPSGENTVSLTRKLKFLAIGLGLMFKLPFRSFRFLNRYMVYTSSVRPKSPHHYLVFIGVDPKMQGQGFGRKALEYVHKLVDGDPGSAGIGLDTENERNVRLYEKFGYELVARKTIQGVTIYSMFRSKPET